MSRYSFASCKFCCILTLSSIYDDYLSKHAFCLPNILKCTLLKLLLFTTNNLDIKSLNIHLQEKGYNSFVTQMSKRKELPFFCKTCIKRSPYLVDSELLWFQQIPFAEFGCLHLQLIHCTTNSSWVSFPKVLDSLAVYGMVFWIF